MYNFLISTVPVTKFIFACLYECCFGEPFLSLAILFVSSLPLSRFVHLSPAFSLGSNSLSQDHGFMSRYPAQVLDVDLMAAGDIDGLHPESVRIH